MDLTDVIGPMGRAQYKALFALLMRPLPGTWLFLPVQISLIELDHWCSPTPSFSNLTSDEWKDCCVPRTSTGRYSRCEYYDFENGNNDTRVTCNSWDYDRTSPYQSTRADWNLVCERGMYVSMLYLSFTLGNLFAYIPTGHLSDRYGRKTVCTISLLLSACICFASGFVTSVEQMLAARFFTGITYASVQNAFICLYLECVGPQYRKWVIMSFSGTYGLFSMMTAGIGYFITDWRVLFYIASFPIHLPVFYILWKFVPESARWMLSVKKYDEARKVILQQAKENGIAVVDPDSVMEELKKKIEIDQKRNQSQATFLDLFTDRKIVRTTLVLYATLFLTVFVYHGYNISIGRLDGSLHMNLVLNGAMDMLAVVFFFTLTHFLSNKKGLILTFFLTGVFFLLTIPIGNDLRWLKLIFALIGRCCSSTSYNILYIFASEIFPTNLRVVGIGGGMSFGRVGSLLASFADDMGRVYGNGAPLTMFGVLSLVSSAIFLLLPELSNQHLPDSLAETRMITSGKADSENVEARNSVRSAQ